MLDFHLMLSKISKIVCYITRVGNFYAVNSNIRYYASRMGSFSYNIINELPQFSCVLLKVQGLLMIVKFLCSSLNSIVDISVCFIVCYV